MSRRLVGVLVAPDGTPLDNGEITVQSIQSNAPDLIKGGRYSFTTDGSGAYDVTLQVGYYNVTATRYGAQIGLGQIAVNTGADTTLPALLEINELPPRTVDAELQGLVDEANAAADRAEEAASESAAGMVVRGYFDASSNTPPPTPSGDPAEQSDFYIISVPGTINGIQYNADDNIVWERESNTWFKIDNTSIQEDDDITWTGVNTFDDSVKHSSGVHSYFGPNDNFSIVNDGTETMLESFVNDQRIAIKGASGNTGKFLFNGFPGAETQLFFDGSKKAETKANGFKITGNIEASSYSGLGTGLSGLGKLGSENTWSQKNTFEDIYHSSDKGTYYGGATPDFKVTYLPLESSGVLEGLTNGTAIKLKGLDNSGIERTMVDARPNSYVRLHHQGALSLSTTNTGVDIPGTLSVDTIENAALYAMTEAEFRALQEDRKAQYNSSGFVEYGKHFNDGASRMPINEGLWTSTNESNQLVLGVGLGLETNTNTKGSSNTQMPLPTIAGASIQLSYVNAPSNREYNVLKLPQAPDGTETYDSSTGVYVQHADSATAFAAETATNEVITSRKDFVALEFWEEVITDKDIVYPYGNVQYAPNTWGGVVLSNALVAQTYSAFGEWDTATTGYGATWSTLTLSEKQKFLSDSKNNIFMNEDGDYVQGRFRIRVIEGFGDEWWVVKNTPSNGDDNYLSYSIENYIKPRGDKLTYSDLGAADSEGVYGGEGASWIDNLNSDLPDIGASVAASGFGVDFNGAHKGNCFLVPIGLVHRRNQGAFHPYFNEGGTAYCTDGIALGSRVFWESPTALGVFNSTKDCFLYACTSANANGAIGTTAVNSRYPRPDGKFYDAIYASDVQDLRLSARVPTLAETLYTYTSKSISGSLLNYKTGLVPFTKVVERGVVEAFSTTSHFELSIGDQALYDVGDFVVFLTESGIYRAGGYVAQKGAGFMRIHTTYNEAVANTQGNTGLFSRTNGDIYTIFKVEYVPGDTWTDVLGDPSNWPRQATGVIDFDTSLTVAALVTGVTVEHEGTNPTGTTGNVYLYVGGGGSANLTTTNLTGASWQDLGPKAEYEANAKGLLGFPLLYGEKGEDLIPDGTTKLYKHHRKTLVGLEGLYTDNKGVSHTIDNGWTSIMPAGNNSRNSTQPSGRVVRVSYTTPAHIFEDQANSKVLKLGDVFANSYHGVDRGGALTSDLIDKVPSNAASANSVSYQDRVNIDHFYMVNDLLSGGASNLPSHDTIKLGTPQNNSPAAKSLSYLTAIDNQLHLVMLAKEMVYDSGSVAGSLPSKDATISQTYTAGEKVRVIFPDSNHLIFVPTVTASYIFEDVYKGNSGRIYGSTGNHLGDVVEGSGWGDDNEFDVVSNTSTTIDDNGNTVLTRTCATPLPWAMSDD